MIKLAYFLAVVAVVAAPGAAVAQSPLGSEIEQLDSAVLPPVEAAPLAAPPTIEELSRQLNEQGQELIRLRQFAEQSQAGAVQLESGLGRLQAGVERLGQNLKVTTVDKQWGLAVFGSLNGEMLYAEKRPFLPSGVTFLFPDLGRDTKTFEVHGKSTNFGAALAGPEILGMKAGGLLLT